MTSRTYQEETKSTQKDNRRRLWLVFFFAGAVLTPALRFGSLPGLRVEQGVLLVWWAAAGIGWLLQQKPKVRIPFQAVMLAGFGLIVLLSMFFGYRAGVPLVLADVYEMGRMGIYALVLVMGSTLMSTQQDKDAALSVLSFCLMIGAFIALSQHGDPLGINAAYLPYTAPTQYEALMRGYPWPRVVGMTTNPNRYAYLAGIGAVLGAMLFVEKKRGWYLLSAGLCFATLWLTRSRTGLIFWLVLAALVWVFFLYAYAKEKKAAMIYIGGGALLGGLLLLGGVFLLLRWLPQDMTWRFWELFDLGASRSWQLRLTAWRQLLSGLNDQLIFGIGPSKGVELGIFVDNEWLLLIKRYGLVGLFSFMAVFSLPALQSRPRHPRSTAVLLYRALLIATGVFMMATTPFHSYQIMSVVMMLIAAGLSDPR